MVFIGSHGGSGRSLVLLHVRRESRFTERLSDAELSPCTQDPETAPFLTADEREWLVNTIKQDTAGLTKAFQWKFLGQALQDPHTYLYMLLYLLYAPLYLTQPLLTPFSQLRTPCVCLRVVPAHNHHRSRLLRCARTIAHYPALRRGMSRYGRVRHAIRPLDNARAVRAHWRVARANRLRNLVCDPRGSSRLCRYNHCVVRPVPCCCVRPSVDGRECWGRCKTWRRHRNDHRAGKPRWASLFIAQDRNHC